MLSIEGEFEEADHVSGLSAIMLHQQNLVFSRLNKLSVACDCTSRWHYFDTSVHMCNVVFLGVITKVMRI